VLFGGLLARNSDRGVILLGVGIAKGRLFRSGIFNWFRPSSRMIPAAAPFFSKFFLKKPPRLDPTEPSDSEKDRSPGMDPGPVVTDRSMGGRALVGRRGVGIAVALSVFERVNWLGLGGPCPETDRDADSAALSDILVPVPSELLRRIMPGRIAEGSNPAGMALIGRLGGCTLTPGPIPADSRCRPVSLPCRLGALELGLEFTGVGFPLAIAPASEPRIPPYPKAVVMAGLNPIESMLCRTGAEDLAASRLATDLDSASALLAALRAASVVEDEAY